MRQLIHFLNEKIHKYPTAKISVTGHSMGAAVATLCAAHLTYLGYKNFIFYTFGCPRVGDELFVKWFDEAY